MATKKTPSPKKETPYDICKYFKKLYSELLQKATFIDFIGKKFVISSSNSFVITSGEIKESNAFFDWLGNSYVRLSIDSVQIMRSMLKKNLIGIEYGDLEMTVSYLDGELSKTLNIKKETTVNNSIFQKINSIEETLINNYHSFEAASSIFENDRIVIKFNNEIILEVPKKFIKVIECEKLNIFYGSKSDIRYVKLHLENENTVIEQYFATI